MAKLKKKIVLTEFAIQVYTNGDVDWGGADEFLLWLMNHKPEEGFLPFARRIQKFGRRIKRFHKG